jgi:DNA polymerase-1
MQPSQKQIIDLLSNVRSEPDGSAIADCPACSLDGKGAGKLKVFVDGSIICYRFNGSGVMRDHLADILKAIGLDKPQENTAFIKETILNGKLTLEISPRERGKQLVVANNCSSIIHRDVINIDAAKERRLFVSALSLPDDESKVVAQVLITLADRFSSAYKAVDNEKTEATEERVVFKALADGRVIEQMSGCGFAVYDPAKGEVAYKSSVTCNDINYLPLDDDFILRGGLQLPDKLIEYHGERTLDAEIEACIRHYCDAPDREIRLAAKYARFSYIADKTYELSYFRAMGPAGSGKSRFIGTVGMICLRPILVTSPSAASLFRMIDAFTPTLIVDECNFEAGSEDTSALMQILNCGFQRLTHIPRMERGPDGRQTLRMFSAYGPKLIGSLKVSDSPAFESRCVPVALQKTSRKDIPFRMNARMMADFAELRSKLVLWRLRNWSKDFESILDQAEAELKGYSIEPRFIQIAIPLYGMLGDDAGLKDDFARMLVGRSEDAANDRRESFDGELMTAIHSLIIEIDEAGNASLRLPEPEEGKPCELVPIERVTEILNADLPEKRKHDARWVGKQIRKLGFTTREINRRDSDYWKKSALVFDRIKLGRLFKLFSLPISSDFNPVNPVSAVNDSKDSGLSDRINFSEEGSETISSGQVKCNQDNGLEEVTGLTGSHLPETEEEGKNEAVEPAFVALDTETEPFDLKRGITPRNAKMIGLALCYDGEKADYVTDPAAWPLMMPESDQTVVFHNAKFDLGVLERSGLPLPTQWEDTLIASHLLDENSEHGLKDLAKLSLNVASPLTFEEADRMRLLDPPVFDEYARNDSRYTHRLWQKFEPEIDAEGLRQVYDLEKSLMPVVRGMESAGMKINLGQLHEMKRLVEDECERIREEIFSHSGCKFDLNSPAKTAAILFDKLGVPQNKNTQGGKRSVDRQALKDVRGYHPAVDAILRYREVDKLASTFVNVLPSFADAAGRIHPEFKSLGAKTGRFSCASPNVQQIPARSELGKQLRGAFIAEEGHRLVVADYSQMELRVLAYYSKDKSLVEAYTSGTETDLHTLTASKMFKKDDVTKQERTIAKMINFGIAYGITAKGLFNRLRPEGHEVTEAECERFIKDYFDSYPGVRQFLDRVEKRIQANRFVRNIFGRRRRLKGRTPREIRQAQNFVIQATAADIAKEAMVRLSKALPSAARLIAMVHDEFIVECPAEIAEEVKELMTAVMTKAPKGFNIPLSVDAHIGDSWAEAK